jgi:hypothetical protein
VLRGVARCAILLEQTLLKLLDNWMRHQAKRLRSRIPHMPVSQPPRKN